MKQFIIALFLLSFSFNGIASPMPIPPPTPIVKEIPLGVEIRKDMVIMYLLCGEPFAISVHAPGGTQIYQGTEMEQKMMEIDAANGGNGIPVVKTDLSNSWEDNQILCIGEDATEENPENKRLPIEEMMDGSRPMWSASYQP